MTLALEGDRVMASLDELGEVVDDGGIGCARACHGIAPWSVRGGHLGSGDVVTEVSDLLQQWQDHFSAAGYAASVPGLAGRPGHGRGAAGQRRQCGEPGID